MGIITSLSDSARNIYRSFRKRRQAKKRQREAATQPGEKLRDGLTGDLLSVAKVSEKRANEYKISGTRLSGQGRNTILDCSSDIVIECHPPSEDTTRAYPASRLIRIGISAGNQARDRFTGDVLKVEQIHDEVAENWLIDGTSLTEMGVNQTLCCSEDWVVSCTYYYSEENREYHFPFSRVVPEKYATINDKWKNEITESQECYSCQNGHKRQKSHSACQSCRERILQRDEWTCQQKNCNSSENLQIHHLRYRPNPVTGKVPDRNLITLCGSHHKARHGIDD